MENPKYILVMRQVASDYDGISHELFQIANNLERMDQFNPQQKLFSLVRNAEVSTVSLRNLTARTVRDDTAHFYGAMRSSTSSRKIRWNGSEAVLSALSITTMRHSVSGAFETTITSKPRDIWM